MKPISTCISLNVATRNFVYPKGKEKMSQQKGRNKLSLEEKNLKYPA